MISSLRSLLTKWKLKYKSRNIRPIVAHDYDIKLLQKAKGKFWPGWVQLRQMRRVLSSAEKWVIKIAFLFLLFGFFWLGSNWVKAHRIVVPAAGGIVTEAVVGSPQFINPIFSLNNDVDADISRLVYSGLVRYDAKNRLVPDLAAKYTVSPDKKVYTFNLRQDAFWIEYFLLHQFPADFPVFWRFPCRHP